MLIKLDLLITFKMGLAFVEFTLFNKGVVWRLLSLHSSIFFVAVGDIFTVGHMPRCTCSYKFKHCNMVSKQRERDCWGLALSSFMSLPRWSGHLLVVNAGAPFTAPSEYHFQ